MNIRLLGLELLRSEIQAERRAQDATAQIDYRLVSQGTEIDFEYVQHILGLIRLFVIRL